MVVFYCVEEFVSSLGCDLVDVVEFLLVGGIVESVGMEGVCGRSQKHVGCGKGWVVVSVEVVKLVIDVLPNSVNQPFALVQAQAGVVVVGELVELVWGVIGSVLGVVERVFLRVSECSVGGLYGVGVPGVGGL